jgi:hypothetical protein
MDTSWGLACRQASCNKCHARTLGHVHCACAMGRTLWSPEFLDGCPCPPTSRHEVDREVATPRSIRHPPSSREHFECDPLHSS